MCERPKQLANGFKRACHECEQCQKRKINDWVGRNIAESRMSDASFSITLTYGRNEANEKIHERTVALTYSDFQNYLKLLRRHGYNVRYFVTGEYGAKNGRAHWHALLYFNGGHPDYIQRENFMHEVISKAGNVVKLWPHGWSFWDDKPSYGAGWYVCKYILKDADDAGKQTFGPEPSKKPPIGMAYFKELAEEYVRAGLAPQSLEYSFNDVRYIKRNGQEEVVLFWLKDRTAELYLDHYIATWHEVHPDREIPNSELVELYQEYGQIVYDEDLLIQSRAEREFPKGESRQPFPTSDQNKQMVRDAESERKMRARTRAYEDLNEWYEQWLKEAKGGEERQKRQGQYEEHYEREGEKFIKLHEEQQDKKYWAARISEGPEPERGSHPE